MTTRCLFCLAIAWFALAGEMASLALADEAKDGGQVITAEALTQAYAADPTDFDKTYQGKVVTVEGTVTDAATKPDPVKKMRYCVLAGYAKTGDPVAHQVNCAIGPGFEGVRIGHKVRVRGTCQAHGKTGFAAELRDCKVVKVLADDYPASKEAAAAVKDLQGKWKVYWCEGLGKQTTRQFKVDDIEVEGYQMSWLTTVQKPGVGHTFLFGLSVDPGKKPKQMTLYQTTGPLPAIYDLDGDKLRICLPLMKKLQDAKRPPDFASGKNGQVILMAERVK